MLVPSQKLDESRRFAALADHQRPDAPGEAVFDTLARLAATICRTPVAFVSLSDREHNHFTSSVGLNRVDEIPIDALFCALARQTPGRILEIEDAYKDQRFAKHALVTGKTQLRFYAGIALLEDGVVLGTLSVLDRKARKLNADQCEALSAIGAAIVQHVIERRATRHAASAANDRIELLSAAMEASEDAVVISIPGATSNDAATTLYVNDAYLRLKGTTYDQVIGQPADIFSGPKTDRTVVTAVRDKLMRGESARAEYITYRRDGTYYHAAVAGRPLVNARGETTHFVITQRDISESVQRGEQLAIQNERLTSLTSIARKIFAALDPHGLIVALLAGVHELVGADARLLIARGNGTFAQTADLAGDETDAPAGDAFIEGATRSITATLDENEERLAMRIPGSLGQTRYILDVKSERPLRKVDVFALGLLGQYFAVAARNVELYGELQARGAAVVELNQVKNDLIAMLAHDFKGPLTTIVGFADVLAEDDRFDDESRKFLAMISSSAMRLASLATDTLALSRLEQNELTLNVEEFDLVALVRDIARVFSVTRAIDLQCDRPELIIGGDAARLRQVFENLIGNAIKYSPNGDAIKVSLCAKGRGVEVSVRDTGIGIPDADKSKLFGRFARAQNARAMGIGGTGFGLYLTKTIVEMHGGTIAVESREGVGSTFSVFVPASIAAPRPQHRRFLLVEPDGDAKSYIAHTLRDDGFAVTVVVDAEAMLAQIDEVQFDAAIVDIEKFALPLDELVRRVSGRTALIRIDLNAVDESPGWDAYLVKPFLMKDLQSAIDAAIMRHPKARRESVVSYSELAGSA